jgi:hypothetical protein
LLPARHGCLPCVNLERCAPRFIRARDTLLLSRMLLLALPRQRLQRALKLEAILQ